MSISGAAVHTSALWYAPITAVIFPLAAAWVLFIGLSLVAGRIGEARFSTTTGDDRWVDVSDEAARFHDRSRRVRTGRIVRLTGFGLILWSISLLALTVPTYVLVFVGLLTYLVAKRSGPYLLFWLVIGFGTSLAMSREAPRREALFLLAASVWVYVIGRRWTRQLYPSYRRGTDRPTLDDWLVRPDILWSRRRIGASLASTAVVAAFLLAVYTFVAAKWTLLTGPRTTSGLHRAARSLPLGHLAVWERLVVALTKSPFALPEVLLIGCVGVLYLINAQVMRLWVPALWEVLPREAPEAFVYLRNFDDDKVKLQAGAYTSLPLLQMIFDVLVPVRKRPFEQVIANLLRRFGPVIGAADPRSRLPTSGTLKASLAHSEWRAEVSRWCESARAVIVSAAPTSIHDGLREELRIISENMGHERIILVLGPGKREEVLSRFAGFKAAMPGGSKLDDDLRHQRVADGTLVMVRVPGRGWDCWGSKYRTEAAYAVALDQAIEYGRTVWGEAGEKLTEVARLQHGVGRRPPASVDVEDDNDAAPYVTTAFSDRQTPPGVEIVPGGLGARILESLAMRCDTDSVPSPRGEATVLGRWAGRAEFGGAPSWRGHSNVADSATFSVAVTENKLFGILTCLSTEEEIWLAVPRSTLRVRGLGEQGRLKKRPLKVEISGEGWTATVGGVDRIFASSGAYQAAQEGSLLRALLSPGSNEPEPEVPLREVEAPGDWHRVDRLQVFVETIDGKRTGRTSLVDPSMKIEAQREHVASLGWLPDGAREGELRRLRGGIQPRPRTVTPGYLQSPVGLPPFAVMRPVDTPSLPLSAYLWPTVDGGLVPILEDDEQALSEWRTESPTGYWVKNDLQSSLPWFRYVPEAVATNVAWRLTNRRLILWTLGRSRDAVGVMHLRFEWMCGLNAERYDYRKQSQRPSLSINVVVGDRDGRRAAFRINQGLSRGVFAEQLLDALVLAVTANHLHFGPSRWRTSDNGKEGILTWEHRPIDGRGYTLDETLIV